MELNCLTSFLSGSFLWPYISIKLLTALHAFIWFKHLPTVPLCKFPLIILNKASCNAHYKNWMCFFPFWILTSLCSLLYHPYLSGVLSWSLLVVSFPYSSFKYWASSEFFSMPYSLLILYTFLNIYSTIVAIILNNMLMNLNQKSSQDSI